MRQLLYLQLDKSSIYRTKMDVPTKIKDRQKREDIAFEEDDFNPNGGNIIFIIMKNQFRCYSLAIL